MSHDRTLGIHLASNISLSAAIFSVINRTFDGITKFLRFSQIFGMFYMHCVHG